MSIEAQARWVADNKELVQSLSFLLGILIASGCAWLWYTIKENWWYLPTRWQVFLSPTRWWGFFSHWRRKP